MRKLLAFGPLAVGAVVAARWLLQSDKRNTDRRPMRQRMIARMMEGLPPDSPPKLVMEILPRLREQNDEVIHLLREQNELLRRGQPEPVTR
jgi:hypothetical protein